MDAAIQLFAEQVVDGPVTRDTVHAFKGLGGDLDPEMRFATFPPATMAPVILGFVDHIQELGVKCGRQFRCNCVFCGHDPQRVIGVFKVKSLLAQSWLVECRAVRDPG